MARFAARLRILFSAVFVCAYFCPAYAVLAQGSAVPSIVSPANGQVLQGQVQITGTTDIPGFSSVELAFAYDPDPTGTWFAIQAANLPLTNDVIARWDTTSITDGDYRLRLRVALADSSMREATVSVHIRNYSAAPAVAAEATPTHKPAVQVPTALIIAASETPTQSGPALLATPSAFPPNPARVTSGEIYSGFWRGALIVGIAILVFGALVRLRRQS